MTFIPLTVSLEDEIREKSKQDKENFIKTKVEIEQIDVDAIEKADRENKKRLIRKIVDQTDDLTVNNQITSQDLNLPEWPIALPLQLPPELNAMVEDITSNVMGKITQKSIINPPEMIVVDPDIPQGSGTETIDYIEGDWIGDMLPETTDDPIPHDVLDSLARISPIRIVPPLCRLKTMNYYLK